MDPARWERIETICSAALECDASRRREFIARACSGDGMLRAQVESLLQQLEQHPTFLERPIGDVRPLVGAEVRPASASGTIGHYRLVRQLGRGGMGEVYLAVHERHGVQQHVALKIIRQGMDTEDVLRRFRLERRILANLSHPNIARLIDAAATPDGRPYFVMEYIDGASLTDFCDERRLSVAERLWLFLQICGAVQHAHRHRIIHRDLKPRNILVGNDGEAKLLDFGIGKVLAPSEWLDVAVKTATNVRLLTPEYAAPEQIAGEPVTTATDVYALGVILYEVLAGHHPYVVGGEPRLEVERAVLETVPPPPSARIVDIQAAGDADADEVARRRSTHVAELQRQLAGDLDDIVSHALRKEPSRRYASAGALATEIRRHLGGRSEARAQPSTG
jgi:serine/threonine protein kinase